MKYLPEFFCFVSTKTNKTASLLTAQAAAFLQLWLPLAVPPCFLVNAHHNALTHPDLLHSKYTKIYLKTSLSSSKCVVYNLHLPLSQHWAALVTAEERISYLLRVAMVKPPSPKSLLRQPPSSSQQSLQKRTLPCKLNM